MAIVAIGVNHRSTPLDLLERLTIGDAELPKLLVDAARRDYVAEVVVLSTCNRTEIYAVVERFHDSFTGLRSVLAERAGVPLGDLADHLNVEYDEPAAEHLFLVASGLDSAVIGETEILGQIKNAWEVARSEGTVGAELNALFRHALHVGKRARTETGISRSIASASAAAVALASEQLDGLEGRRVLVLGAGEMGEQMAVALAGAGVAEVHVANRTAERAKALAARVGGSPIPLSDIASALAHVDVLLTSTGAVSQLVNRSTIAGVMAARAGRPLSIIDIAVPRDVDPRVAELPGVSLFDMEDISAFVSSGIARRRGEIDAVSTIIEEELAGFCTRRKARSVAPVIAELHSRAESVRRAEFSRFSGRLDGLSDRQREAVEALTHGIVAKLLHNPSVRLGELAGSVRGDRAVDALRDLYGMDDDSSDGAVGDT